jgi:hypothetical protein
MPGQGLFFCKEPSQALSRHALCLFPAPPAPSAGIPPRPLDIHEGLFQTDLPLCLLSQEAILRVGVSVDGHENRIPQAPPL